ncbi:endonuclease V [Halorarius litoreus]|uniref:endonuclease V n=1 Tax=Halorarius litoreus TaxID=2962676 RepID=UPI0020CC8B66|nr:endonuclease V [Halorarius litoreus]
MRRDRFIPDPSLSRTEMEQLQREVAAAARFEDDLDVTVHDIERGDALVAGVDQAFLPNRDPQQAISAIVVLRGDEVVERAYAVTDLSIPYVPGLLSFREGGPILAAFEELEAEPDVLVFDGSGRIHFRQAGLATHLGVILDAPSVGVAKSLLCGTPRSSVDGLPQGAKVAIEADDSMDAPAGEVVGYAYQSRQYPNSRSINPLYVSPGHRVSAETAVDLVAACGGDYKLPEPTRLADAYADEVKHSLADKND